MADPIENTKHRRISFAFLLFFQISLLFCVTYKFSLWTGPTS